MRTALPLVFLIAWVAHVPGWAQEKTSSSTPTPSIAPVPTEKATPSEKTFTPHWTGQVGGSFNEQTAQNEVQVQEQVNLTATYNLTEGGHYLTAGITGGQQVVEGINTNYGQMTLGGGLGWGIFLPSLQVQSQQGAAALNSLAGTLNLNFKLFDDLQLGPMVSGGLESHQGPLTQLGFSSDAVDEIDSGNYSLGIQAIYSPWDFLNLTFTAQQEYDDTYQFQNVTHTFYKSINQRGTLPSMSLEEDLTFWKNYQFELTEQAGQEDFPAGISYSPILRRTVFNKTPTNVPFTGLMLGLVYNFE